MRGLNQYPPMTGVAPLRQAIAQKALDCYGAQVDPDSEITVTTGGTEAIFNAIHAVVRAGDEVIVLDPAYDCYEPAIDLAGAGGARGAGPADLRGRLGPRARGDHPATRMLIVNTPHNPSGAMLSAGHAGAGRAAARHRHLPDLR
jgi:methionine aminotransferase